MDKKKIRNKKINFIKILVNIIKILVKFNMIVFWKKKKQKQKKKQNKKTKQKTKIFALFVCGHI